MSLHGSITSLINWCFLRSILFHMFGCIYSFEVLILNTYAVLSIFFQAVTHIIQVVIYMSCTSIFSRIRCARDFYLICHSLCLYICQDVAD
jgi:hypothetical protein